MKHELNKQDRIFSGVGALRSGRRSAEWVWRARREVEWLSLWAATAAGTAPAHCAAHCSSQCWDSRRSPGGVSTPLDSRAHRQCGLDQNRVCGSLLTLSSDEATVTQQQVKLAEQKWVNINVPVLLIPNCPAKVSRTAFLLRLYL